MTDHEYLSCPLLENVTYSITDTEIKITGSSTQFIHVRRFVPLDVNAILNQYVEVRQTVKQRKAKISYCLHLRKRILENQDQYMKDCQEARWLFGLMTATAREIQKRGLHYGTVNDTVLKKLNDDHAAYLALFWGNRSISIMSDVKSRLDAIPGYLSKDDATDITIYM